MKIALLGDIAFYGVYSLENESVFHYFEDIAKILRQYDYVIGNLETPFVDNGRPYGAKSAHIKAKENNVELLKFLNINIVNLANNHIFDYGITGYEKTKKILSDNSIQYFGIENKEIFLVCENNKLALSGYCCYSTNAFGYQENIQKAGINVLDGYFLERNLIENDKNGYLNIVSIHAGQEHVNYPNTNHIQLARILAQKTSYVYYGHHPHVIQGIEKIDKSLIAYSLGNFCFDDVYTNKSTKPLIVQKSDNKKSFILVIEIQDNNIIDYEIIPFYLGSEKVELFNDEILNEIDNYSIALTLNEKKIDAIRSEVLSDYFVNRKRNRDFEWYIKRINFNSIKMILNAKRNLKEYNKKIVQYIDSRRNNDEF